MLPIVLFAGEDPELFKKSLHSLTQTSGFADSKVYVFSNAPNSANAVDNVREVRRITREFIPALQLELTESTRFKDREEFFNETLERLFAKHDFLIILEDSQELSKGYLSYINQAFELYREEEKLWCINAYSPLSEQQADKLPDTFFTRFPFVRAYGLHKRAFEEAVIINANGFTELSENEEKTAVAASFHAGFEKEFRKGAKSKVPEFEMRLWAAALLKEGLCLNPKKSMVNPLSKKKGAAFKVSGFSHEALTDGMTIGEKIPIEINSEAEKQIQTAVGKNLESTVQKVGSFLKKLKR